MAGGGCGVPLYEYECPKDGRFELIRSFSDPPLKKCPKCGKPVEKLASAPAFQFKGTGWYVTDYANKGKGKSGDEGKSEKSESKSEGKSESKSESKSDGKSESKSESSKADSGKSKDSGKDSSSSSSSKASKKSA
jgi:putative FmdB family regulatory protein